MTLRVTVWNEFRHEKQNELIGAIYPDGMHTAIANRLRKESDFEVRTATLDEPEHGLTQEVLDDDRCADLVGPHGPRRGLGRGRRADPGAGARWHGTDRPPLRPLLEDIQGADGHELRPEVARGERQRADLDRQPGASDHPGLPRVHRHRAGGDVRRAFRHPGAG